MQLLDDNYLERFTKALLSIVINVYIFIFQEWELLILYKLQWELTAITSIDYLDHTLPRLGLDDITQRHGLEAIEATELRRRTETILVLVATDYQFCYHNPSLLAASAILTALQSMSVDNEKVLREIRLRLQTATHTATVSLMEYYLQMIEFSNDAEHCSF